MPDYERLAEENEWRLETASFRDPPSINYGIELLEQSLAPLQQLQQQQSGGRKKTVGGISYRDKYKAWIVEIRIPKWPDFNKLWINSGDLLAAAQYNADAAFFFIGKPPFHFPNANLDYLPLLLGTGEELTTREKCSAHVAKIAKGSASRGQRRDFRERVQKLIHEMVRTPYVVRFLIIVRLSLRQAWQPRLQANPEETYSPVTEGENGTAMEAGTPSEEAMQASASTVTVNPSQCDSLVFEAQDAHSARADDSEEENRTPLEVDSVSKEVIRALAPTVIMDPTALLQVHSTMTSYSADIDWSTAYIPSIGMNPDEPQNSLTSVSQSIGIRHPNFGEKEKEDLVPDEDEEEEIYKSLEDLNVEL